MNFIYKLYQKKQPLFCVEFSHISLSPINDIISNDDLTDGIAAMLTKHKCQQATFTGHSFGTFVMSRMCMRHPTRVSAAVFIDPVCFQLFLPDVVTNFLYQTPTSLFDYVRYFLVTKNLHMNYVLRRHFWWYQLNLWKENLPEKVLCCPQRKRRDRSCPVCH